MLPNGQVILLVERISEKGKSPPKVLIECSIILMVNKIQTEPHIFLISLKTTFCIFHFWGTFNEWKRLGSLNLSGTYQRPRPRQHTTYVQYFEQPVTFLYAQIFVQEQTKKHANRDEIVFKASAYWTSNYRLEFSTFACHNSLFNKLFTTLTLLQFEAHY